MYLGRNICRDIPARSLSVPGAAFGINLTGHKSHANPRNAITAARIAVTVVATAAAAAAAKENTKLVEYASGRDPRRYRRAVGVTRNYPFAFIAGRSALNTPFKGRSRAIRRSHAVRLIYILICLILREREREREGGGMIASILFNNFRIAR
jgi:hypothetical protein